jgi:hypothetical protein
MSGTHGSYVRKLPWLMICFASIQRVPTVASTMRSGMRKPASVSREDTVGEQVCGRGGCVTSLFLQPYDAAAMGGRAWTRMLGGSRAGRVGVAGEALAHG